jgi:hypothetical protein
VTCEGRSRISITGYQPAIFTQSELWVTFAVVLTNGALVLLGDNRRAFFGGLGLSATGLGVALLALATYWNGFLSPFAFTLFERLIALTGERGNIGYLIYLPDALGYLGYVGMMLARGAISSKEEFLAYFLPLGTGLRGAALVALLGACAFYSRRNNDWGESGVEGTSQPSVA